MPKPFIGRTLAKKVGGRYTIGDRWQGTGYRSDRQQKMHTTNYPDFLYTFRFTLFRSSR